MAQRKENILDMAYTLKIETKADERVKDYKKRTRDIIEAAKIVEKFELTLAQTNTFILGFAYVLLSEEGAEKAYKTRRSTGPDFGVELLRRQDELNLTDLNIYEKAQRLLRDEIKDQLDKTKGTKPSPTSIRRASVYLCNRYLECRKNRKKFSEMLDDLDILSYVNANLLLRKD